MLVPAPSVQAGPSQIHARSPTPGVSSETRLRHPENRALASLNTWSNRSPFRVRAPTTLWGSSNTSLFEVVFHALRSECVAALPFAPDGCFR